MKLVCVILAGGNREDVIGGAILSVFDAVDGFVLVDTGESAQAAIAVARDMLGSRCRVFKRTEEHDCAEARNFGLDKAAEIGADWALMLDTDERIIGAEKIRRMLKKYASETEVETVLIDDVGHLYKKNKLFRLPRAGYWSGNVHEGYVCPGIHAVAKNITFSETPKGTEETAARNVMIEHKCRESIEADPKNPRWHFYLGDVLCGSDPETAVDEFLKAAELSDWLEEIDWSHYRAAMCRFIQGRYADALEICLNSSMRIPELAWYASVCSASLGKLDQTVELVNKTVELAEQQRGQERLGFVNRVAWYEGPYEVMSWIHASTGDDRKYRLTLEKIEQLRAERLAMAA
jgi:glycosyltransferase involved in cell wall biosynthesis